MRMGLIQIILFGYNFFAKLYKATLGNLRMKSQGSCNWILEHHTPSPMTANFPKTASITPHTAPEGILRFTTRKILPSHNDKN